jgi:hypothetical protein
MNPGSAGGTSSAEAKGELLRALQLKKLHIEPEALRLSPANIQRRYEHNWAPIAELAGRLRPWPEGLLRYVLRHQRGHILLTHRPSSYQEGGVAFGRGELSGVAHISLGDMGGLRYNHVLGHLLDDLLGRGDEPKGSWLSEGGGTHERLAEVGQRIQRLWPLGHGVDEVAQEGPRDYFAQSWAIYWHDSRRLNAADPLIFKLLRGTLVSPGFWKGVER